MSSRAALIFAFDTEVGLPSAACQCRPYRTRVWTAKTSRPIFL